MGKEEKTKPIGCPVKKVFNDRECIFDFNLLTTKGEEIDRILDIAEDSGVCEPNKCEYNRNEIKWRTRNQQN